MEFDSSFFEIALSLLGVKALVCAENLNVHKFSLLTIGGDNIVIKIPEQVNRVLEILRQNGHTAYVVGGACRDMFMGREIHDWDVATSALPEQTAKAFEGYRVIETGIKHGTVTVLVDLEPVEITTYRTESGYSDNRHPDSVEFTARIEDDLSRRDFTVNAIAYSPLLGTVDPFDGMEDTKRKIIRCVGNPDTRFNEDGLRILRALRFASVLGFEIETETAASIKRNKELLKNISVERIFEETTKLLCGVNAAKILNEYYDVFFFVFPELEAMKGCAQHHERHIFDVWGHTLKVLESIRPEAELRWVALLHDSGKPAHKTTDENGIDHFYRHAYKSRNIANDILLRMKTSNAFRKSVCTLVEHHDFLPDKISRKTYRRFIAQYGTETVRKLFEIREADIKGQNPVYIDEGLASNAAGLETLAQIEAEDSCFTIKDLDINGKDLMAIGVPRQHIMSEIFEILLDEVMDDRLKNKKDALLHRAKELMKGKEL